LPTPAWRNPKLVMDHRLIAITLGGLLPAIMLGIAGIFQKFSTNGGIGTGPFLIGVGVITVIVGGVFLVIEKQVVVTGQSAAFTVLYGLMWATATGFIALALGRYNGQISQLVPLYNMNTLVAVVLGLLIFAEWRHVDPVKLLVAAVLIVAGGVLAARA